MSNCSSRYQSYRKVRKMAEAFFAGAILLAPNNPDLAREQANSCLYLLNLLPSKTVEDCASSTVLLGGVLIPNFLYTEVAKQKFLKAGIKLVS